MLMRHGTRGLARSARLLSSESAGGVRWRSTLTLGEEKEQKEQVVVVGNNNGDGGSGNKDVSSYWGIKPEQVKKDDGTPWKWNCFRVCISMHINIYCMF